MHTWKLTDCTTDLAIIYNTTKSSKEKQNYICCYLVFVLRKSLCSLLEWSQDINIKSKIFRIKTQHDKIISDVYATPFTCKIKKKKKKRWKNELAQVSWEKFPFLKTHCYLWALSSPCILIVTNFAASSISLSFKLCSINYTAKKSQKILARTGWLEDIYFVILSADFV